MEFNNLSGISISFLMPVKDGAVYLENAMKAIIQNSEQGDQIIIVNDGSTDNTLKILKKWEKKHSNINLVNTRSQGLVNALNVGIRAAEKQFIARFDVDDLYDAERIAIQKKLLNAKVGAVFCDYEIVSAKVRSLGVIPCAVSPELTKLSLFTGIQTPHPGVIFNRDAVNDLGGYIPEDFPAEDLGLWIRLASKYELIGVPKTLLKYRIHRNSITSSNRSRVLKKRNEIASAFIKSYRSGAKNAFYENLRRELTQYKDTEHAGLRYFLHLKNLKQLVEVNYQMSQDAYRKDVEKLIFQNSFNLTGDFINYARRKSYRFIPNFLFP